LKSTVAAPIDTDTISPNVRRAAIGLAILIFGVPILLAGFIIAIDPYYLFGMPGWHGFNLVRPTYEPYAVAVKPYQVWRMRPQAVVLGGSSPEVGIDPRHPGWGTAKVFNFSIPSSTSYVTTLAFLHAQKLGARQVIASLDFFSFNINFPLGAQFDERRFLQSAYADFARYLDETLPAHPAPTPARITTSPGWNEQLYLAVNQDVAAAIARKEFKSGREHYELAGRAEHRDGNAVPDDWDEAGYLEANPDVATEISRGGFISGYHHYLAAGRAEGRLGGFRPRDWDEAGYLAANPVVRNRVALGIHRTGFAHYAAEGRRLGFAGGLPPVTMFERMERRFPGLDKVVFNLREIVRLSFSATAMSDAVSTIRRQSEPADLDELGMRVWGGHDQQIRKFGGTGKLIRGKLATGGGNPWLPRPRLQYCFGNAETGMTTFDPYRFMLRRAYAEGTDLRLFTTPVHAAFLQLFHELGLYERYESWLKELVRINAEEAARADRQPFPLWHFGDVNQVTSEPIPTATDMTPMTYYWDHTHYRKAAGDLMLDRIFSYRDPARVVPDDFGVNLTATDVEAHLKTTRTRLADWASSHADLATIISDAARSPTALSRQISATCW
jgi:hypothetical protein